MVRVLLTGADGILGTYLMRRFSTCQVIPVTRRVCEITDAERVRTIMKDAQPDAIIHAAALTDVDLCEQIPDLSYRVNVEGTRNLLQAAESHKCLFVYISSTGVYGNHKRDPYTEADDTNPTTVHHSSKLAAERLVASLSREHLIVRTGWLFGGNRAHRRNFVVRRCAEARQSSVLYADGSQRGNPTFAGNVANQLYRLLETSFRGLFNCSDHESASRYEYVRRIVQLSGSKTEVIEAPPGFFRRVAPVSENESATNSHLERLGLDCMDHWKDSLAGYMGQMGLLS